LAVSEDPESLAQQIIKTKASVAETEKLVKSGKRSSNSRNFTQKTLGEDIIAQYEKDIKTKIGGSVKIRERKGGAGDIIISFRNRIELTEIIDKLK